MHPFAKTFMQQEVRANNPSFCSPLYELFHPTLHPPIHPTITKLLLQLFNLPLSHPVTYPSANLYTNSSTNSSTQLPMPLFTCPHIDNPYTLPPSNHQPPILLPKSHTYCRRVLGCHSHLSCVGRVLGAMWSCRSMWLPTRFVPKQVE